MFSCRRFPICLKCPTKKGKAETDFEVIFLIIHEPLYFVSCKHVWHAFNALFIIRCLVKYVIETGSEYQLLQHFEAIPSPGALNTANGDSTLVQLDEQNATPPLVAHHHVDGSKFESFFDAVVNLIVVIPVKCVYEHFTSIVLQKVILNHIFREFTYHLHLEAVNSIIVLFSLHLFTQQPNEKLIDKSMIYRTIYKNQNANTLMGALLHYVSRMVEVPQTMFGLPGGSSFVFGLADTLMSIFTFRKTHQDFLSADDLPATFKLHYPLANQSLLLILILTNHSSMKTNPYRVSLFGCSDSQGNNDLKLTRNIVIIVCFNFFKILQRMVPPLKLISVNCILHYVASSPSTRLHYCCTFYCTATTGGVNLLWPNKICSNWYTYHRDIIASK